MSQVAREWDRLSQAEKRRRRDLMVSRVYRGDAAAFNRDLEARPRYVGRALLSIDRIIGADLPPRGTGRRTGTARKPEGAGNRLTEDQRRRRHEEKAKTRRPETEKPKAKHEGKTPEAGKVKAAAPSFASWTGVDLAELKRIPGFGDKTVEALRRGGYEDVGQVYSDSVSGWGRLAAVKGIGAETAKNLFREIESRVPTKNQLKEEPRPTQVPGRVDRIEQGVSGKWEVWLRTGDYDRSYRSFDSYDEAVAYAGRGEGEAHDVTKGRVRAKWEPVPPPPELSPHLKRFKNRFGGVTEIREPPVYVKEKGWMWESAYGGGRFTAEELQEAYERGRKAEAKRRDLAKQSKTLERPNRKNKKALERWNREVQPLTVLGRFPNSRGLEASARINVEGDTVEVRDMDPSHVSLYRLKLPNAGLIPDGEYGIEQADTGYTSPLKHPTRVEWDAPDQTLRFHRGSYTAEFKLAPPDAVDASEVPTPRLNYQGRFRMRLKPLLKLVRNASEDTQNMKVVMEGSRNPTVKFTWASGPGYSEDRAVVEELFEPRRYSWEDEPLLESEMLDGGNRVSAYYDPSYLRDFLERAKRMGVETATFEYLRDMPLHISADGGSGEAEFWEAPRIVTDEEAGV